MAYVPVAVIEKPSQRRGDQIVQFRLDADHVYEFAKMRANKDGSALYVCVGCKSESDQKRRLQLPAPKCAMVKVVNGYFVEDPSNPQRNGHVCQPKKAPVADARREVIAFTNKLLESREMVSMKK